MAAGIALDVEWQDDLTSVLRQAAAGGRDLSAPMKEIAVYLEGVEADRFTHGEGPGGVKWRPSRRVLEHGGQTLVLSGDLQSSVHAVTDPRSVEIGPEASFGAAVYAAIHQFGGTIRAKAKKALHFGQHILASVFIPARPYVGFDDDDQERMTEILSDFVRTLFGGSAVPA